MHEATFLGISHDQRSSPGIILMAVLTSLQFWTCSNFQSRMKLLLSVTTGPCKPESTQPGSAQTERSSESPTASPNPGLWACLHSTSVDISGPPLVIFRVKYKKKKKKIAIFFVPPSFFPLKNKLQMTKKYFPKLAFISTIPSGS